MKSNFLLIFAVLMNNGCSNQTQQHNKARLLVVDPQHFHAALVQKYAHPKIDSIVHLFAEREGEILGYNKLISQYNDRKYAPTKWETVSYYGIDYLQQAASRKQGNVAILAGDNNKKITYIKHISENGIDVFADKPLVIDRSGYIELDKLLSQKKSLVYDIMSERYDVKNELLKVLILDKDFSGGFEENSLAPLITFSSTHHFIKEVSGKPLIRPALFFDVKKQGEGLVDVTTHYIDLVQWILSSEKVVVLEKDLKLQKSERWTTVISKEQFTKATNLTEYPNQLVQSVKGNQLEVFSNGKIDYLFKNIPVSIAVQWNVESKDGKGDKFHARFLTKKVQFEILPDDSGKPSIYLKPIVDIVHFEEKVKKALVNTEKFFAVTIKKVGSKYQLIVPSELYLNHEEHFAKVLDQFLIYRKQKTIPEWETSFLRAKYHLTTLALEKAATR